MSASKELLHEQLADLEAQGANWQRIMVAHALVDLELATAIECAMPRCIKKQRTFSYRDPDGGLRLSIDHKLPISQGGTHLPENLRLAHLGCNSAAARHDPAVFDRKKAQALERKRQMYAKATAALQMKAMSEADNDALDPETDKLLREVLETGSWQWLESTRKLQSTVYSVRYEQLVGNDLADYLIWNALALTTELSEFMGEVRWKNWAKNRGEVERDKAVGELIDIGHFLGNLAAALGVSDSEWEVRYREKQATNARRQETPGGFVGAEKCPKCLRELDRPGATYTRDGVAVGGPTRIFCSHCNTTIREVTNG